MVDYAYEILERAQSLNGCKYWYGGKVQTATKALANALKSANPSVWTNAYYKTALKDVDGVTKVCDCSGLVCYAYNISNIGTSQFPNRFGQWCDTPRAGMIAWKKGHCGIFLNDGWDSPIIEMQNQANDYRCSRTFKEAGFSIVYCDSRIDYNKQNRYSDELGWHKDANGWWYRYNEGTGPSTYYHDCEIYIAGHKYRFDSEGYIVTWQRVPPTSETGWLV